MVDNTPISRFDEASFSSDKIAQVLDKTCRVIGRLAGEHIAFSPIPDAFASGEGRFHGFYAAVGSAGKKIRFNVRYGGISQPKLRTKRSTSMASPSRRW
jgi:hypothetical protein